MERWSLPRGTGALWAIRIADETYKESVNFNRRAEAWRSDGFRRANIAMLGKQKISSRGPP